MPPPLVGSAILCTCTCICSLVVHVLDMLGVLLDPGTSTHDFVKSVSVRGSLDPGSPDPLPNKNKKGESLDHVLDTVGRGFQSFDHAL